MAVSVGIGLLEVDLRCPESLRVPTQHFLFVVQIYGGLQVSVLLLFVDRFQGAAIELCCLTVVLEVPASIQSGIAHPSEPCPVRRRTEI